MKLGIRRRVGSVLVLAAVAAIGAWGESAAAPISVSNPALELGPNHRLITILGTNDIHGGIEMGAARDGAPMGGLSFWSGVVSSIRQGLRERFGDEKAGVLVVDAGDQFQGTLLSNYSEGLLMFQAMSAMARVDASGNVIEAGYDAIVPGNHDYDFGPVGWLADQVTPESADRNPRGALERAVAAANFPLISANTFLTASIVDRKGKPIKVSNSGCRPSKGSKPIDWSQARSPGFLRPYVIKEVAGVRVALVGIDSARTPSATTAANVSDLCFADEVSSYKRVRKELEGQADVFVVVMHGGNTDNSSDATDFVQKAGTGMVDALISGHTHWVTNLRHKGVPVIQSGSGGLKFGRVDLVYDVRRRKVMPSRTRSYGGIELFHDRCSPFVRDFCSVAGAEGGRVSYEGVEARADERIAKLLRDGREQVDGFARKRLGKAEAWVKVDRTRESPLANALTDALRAVSGAEISFMNAGGIRAPVQPGEFTYEMLYKVLPFNNHGLVIGPMSAAKVVALLERSITTCGAFGALMQSGLRVSFTRDCREPVDELDRGAALLSVETLGGEVIYDGSRGGLLAASSREFQVVTLDFLAAGGSGFDGFKGTPVISDLGIVREALARHYAANPVTLTGETDGRWSERLPSDDEGEKRR
jgi:5'-nucleotidase